MIHGAKLHSVDDKAACLSFGDCVELCRFDSSPTFRNTLATCKAEYFSICPESRPTSLYRYVDFERSVQKQLNVK